MASGLSRPLLQLLAVFTVGLYGEVPAWLHAHVLWEDIGDVVPRVAIQALLQPLLIQVVT